MSELEKLIKELCPNGVEYRKIKETFQRLKGTPITAAKMKDIDNPNGEIKVFAGGKTVISAKEKDIPNANIIRVPAVLVQSRGVIDVIYYEKPFTFKNEMWAYTTDNKIKVKFLYYVLKNNIQKFREAASGMGALPQISLPVTEEFTIPLPPLPVQQEIVRILDNFTKLTKELTKELTARKKQYEYYRDRLLSFDDIRAKDQTDNGGGYNNNVIYRKLGEVARFMRGITYNKGQESHNGIGIKVLRANNITLDYNTLNFDDIKIVDKNVKVKDEQYLEKNDILICAGSGSKDHIGKVAYIKENMDYTFGGFMGVIRVTEECNSRFMFHILTGGAFKKYLEATLNSSTINNLNSQVMNNFFLPVPPLETQKRIVSILDKFEMFANSLSDGLPAEIEARKKQYEYYRDKLLDFKDVGGGYYLLEKIVQWLPLGEIATITRGGNFQKKDFASDGIPCIHYGQIYTKYGLYANETFTFVSEEVAKKSKKATTNDIIMAVTSENIEDVCKCMAWLGKEDVAVSGHTAIIHHNQNAKYLAYYFHTQMFFAQKEKYAHGTKVIEVTPSKLSDIVIPLPPLEIQGWIAEILDKFHSLVTDISEGLPAEIEARKKQYEYYRDKLLAFKNLKNVV